MKKFEYKRNDGNLNKDLARAGKLLQKFNSTNYESEQLKLEILTELFGTVGKRNFC